MRWRVLPALAQELENPGAGPLALEAGLEKLERIREGGQGSRAGLVENPLYDVGEAFLLPLQA